MKHLGIMGYDSHANNYTYFFANSVGGVGTAKGSVTGSTWTWATEDKLAGKAIKGRFTATTSSPTQYTYKYEMVDAKGAYTTIEEGESTKAAR